MPTIQEVIESFQKAVLREEKAAARRLVRTYRVTISRLLREQAALADKVTARRAAGLPVRKSWLWKLDRYVYLVEECERAMQHFQEVVQGSVEGRMALALTQGTEYAELITRNVLQRMYGPIHGQIYETFGVVPHDALEAMVGQLLPTSPLMTETFANFSATTTRGIANALTSNLLAGYGPRMLAREMNKAWGVPLTRALTISRTEYLRALRMGTLAQWRNNPHLIRGWIWHSALDPGRTCAVCAEMHGSVHTLEETLDDHPRGGCTMVPVTASWKDMGLEPPPGVDETVGWEVEDAQQWFDQLPKAEQLRMMGKRRLEAYNAGDVKWGALVKQWQDPDWGRQFGLKTLKELGL